MTIDQLRTHLRVIHRQWLGGEGRLSLTIDPEGKADYVSHWTPTGSYYEKCQAIGMGSLEDCLHALANYAQTYSIDQGKRPTEQQLASTLGLTEQPTAAE